MGTTHTGDCAHVAQRLAPLTQLMSCSPAPRQCVASAVDARCMMYVRRTGSGRTARRFVRGLVEVAPPGPHPTLLHLEA